MAASNFPSLRIRIPHAEPLPVSLNGFDIDIPEASRAFSKVRRIEKEVFTHENFLRMEGSGSFLSLGYKTLATSLVLGSIALKLQQEDLLVLAVVISVISLGCFTIEIPLIQRKLVLERSKHALHLAKSEFSLLYHRYEKNFIDLRKSHYILGEFLELQNPKKGDRAWFLYTISEEIRATLSKMLASSEEFLVEQDLLAKAIKEKIHALNSADGRYSIIISDDDGVFSIWKGVQSTLSRLLKVRDPSDPSFFSSSISYEYISN